MSNIKIDINLVIKDIKKDLEDLSEDLISSVQKAVGIVAISVENEAHKLASERLANPNTYIQGIKREKIGENTWVIYIDNPIAQKLEEGWGSYDMKPGFLNSSKAKKGRKGKYLDIPLEQHPGSKKRGTNKVVSYREAVEAAIKEANIATRIEEFNSESIGLNRFGTVERFDNLKDPKVKGLVKITPPNSKSQYFLFRRVSENSDPKKWIHPGFPGIDIFENDLRKFAEKEIDRVLRNILGG
jgi:hypothetical protein